MAYDRMTSNDPAYRETVYRDSDSGTRTVIYIVAALIVLGLVYLAVTSFWGAAPTTTPASTTTIENNVPAPADPVIMAPAPEAVAPAPSELAPAPDVTAPPAATPAPDADLAPAAPPAVEPAQ
jgi:hypothetical protein